MNSQVAVRTQPCTDRQDRRTGKREGHVIPDTGRTRTDVLTSPQVAWHSRTRRKGVLEGHIVGVRDRRGGGRTRCIGRKSEGDEGLEGQGFGGRGGGGECRLDLPLATMLEKVTRSASFLGGVTWALAWTLLLCLVPSPRPLKYAHNPRNIFTPNSTFSSTPTFTYTVNTCLDFMPSCLFDVDRPPRDAFSPYLQVFNFALLSSFTSSVEDENRMCLCKYI